MALACRTVTPRNRLKQGAADCFRCKLYAPRARAIHTLPPKSGRMFMDLGIAGRKAIVCASSRGLGRACAFRLAEAGCEVVVNGRDKAKTEATAAEIAKATKAKVTPVVADVATPAGQAALFAACPEPDILVNNNAGPPFRDFRELDRQKMLDGVIGNMIVAIELIQKVIDPMAQRK